MHAELSLSLYGHMTSLSLKGKGLCFILYLHLYSTHFQQMPTKYLLNRIGTFLHIHEKEIDWKKLYNSISHAYLWDAGFQWAIFFFFSIFCYVFQIFNYEYVSLAQLEP